MSCLVLAEHDGTRLRAGTLSAVAVARDFAARTGGGVEVLLIGAALDAAAADAARFAPVLRVEHPLLEHPTADRYAQVLVELATARRFETLLAAATTFAKDVFPRAAAVMGAAMVSDVIGVGWNDDGSPSLRRPVYAGSATATVELAEGPRVLTIRASAFPRAEPLPQPAAIVSWPVNAATLSHHIEYVGLESRPTTRPEITEARVVVAGGRPFRSSAEFEQHVGALADAFHGATGCTRALVDAGIAPNEWQVGQTGKVVAPELYVALGVSGAIQHLAGMKNSRVVVAVNQDPDAPIFSIANYGLVGDVRQIVPALIHELRR
jgi:electron transfer flavoprotein alpha subunit